MAKFVPIRDIESYVQSLKTEGFYSDEKIQQIREKHEMALATMKPKVYEVKENPMEYKEYVKSHDGYYTKLEVTRHGKIKFRIIFPWREYNEWIAKNGVKKTVPADIVVRCLFLNGACKKYCQCVYNARMRQESMMKKM